MQLLENETLWETVRSDFESIFPQDVYQTWFRHIEPMGESEDEITLGVPNDFAAIWIQDNYHDVILKRLQMASGRSLSVTYKVKEGVPVASVEPKREEEKVVKVAPKKVKKAKGEAANFLLNPKNTFENYIVGSGSQMAHAACIAVANAPARAYNPLFLYGETGLGKTHLMHAVAHHALNSDKDTKIAYVSTEKFTNEFIHAIQTNTLPQFRKHYRSVDILLIDDIHFLSGKERIQEEFFHTFNELFESQKQILLTSDRPVSEIAKLESRLVSRFQWGLVSDIQAPDYETRVAILSKKCDQMGLNLSEEVLNFLAERVSRNVRRMEGALTRIQGYVTLVKAPVTIEAVEHLLKDILQEEAQNRVTVEKIQQAVTEHYNLRASDMQSKRRPANIAIPRQIAMYLSRTMTPTSLQDIGEAFGGRDHGTVIHACKSVENMIDQDEAVKRNVDLLIRRLGGRT